MSAALARSQPGSRGSSWLVLALSAGLGACSGASGAAPAIAPDAAAETTQAAPSRRLIPQDAPRTGPVRTDDLAPLPEDESAGKRSEAQWREHLDYEERERQMWFDQPRMAQHRALAKAIAQARGGIDSARSERALETARKQMARKLSDLRARLAQLDPWGVNSRLLPDYARLFELLEGGYADAKLSALRGDAGPLTAAARDFDQHMEHMAEWLEEVEHEPEGEGERESERERAHERDRERPHERDR